MKIILGSQSLGRKQLLEKAGYSFEVMSANIDEKAIRSDDYEKLPLLIAHAKADKLLEKITETAILITADQVVVCNGELREKPENEAQAREYLESYNHFPAQTNSAVVVTNTKTGKRTEGLVISTVFFKHIPNSAIERIVNHGIITHAAGGFIHDHPLFKEYIDHIEGFEDSVTGLPLNLTSTLIKQAQE